MINRPGTRFTSVAQYMRALPIPVRGRAEELRRAIRRAAPHADEVISYNMPAYKANGVLVYFAGYEKHVGFYPTSAPMRVFKSDLSTYKTSKGAIRFALDKAIPGALVRKIVKFRIEEDVQRAAARVKRG